MKISIDLNYEQLLVSVKQLPLPEKKKLIEELAKEIHTEEKPNNLQELLLKGPTWSEADYRKFLKTRAQLNKVGSHDFG